MYQGQGFDIAAVMPAALDTGLFVSLCTIQMPTGELTADGSPAMTGGDSGDGWNNVAGLIDIPCMDAPEGMESRIMANTNRSPEFIEGFQYRHVLLGGYYPDIEQFDDWRAIVDGQAWDAIGVESDSQSTQTRLRLQLAAV